MFTYSDPETQLIVETVRRYAEEYLIPEIPAVEADDDVSEEVRKKLKDKAIELGLYGYNVSADMGGPGLSLFKQAAIASELGGIPTALKKGLTLPVGLMRFVSAEQRPWLFDPVISGDKAISSAFTEPGGGSDLGNIKTRAEFDGTNWIINGEKQFISDFDQADYIITLVITHPQARFRERFTAFIVEPGGPGFEYTPRLRLMCWRGLHLGGFRFTNFKVAPDHILGEAGRGFEAMMTSVNSTRLRQAAGATGMAEHVMDALGEHVVTRRTFGQRLGDHQAIMFTLADRDLEVHLARLLWEDAARIGDSLGTESATTDEFRLAMSRAKLYATEMLARVVDTAVQLFGAAGITRDLPIERWYRDARVGRISEGAVEMQRIQLGRAFMGRYADKVESRISA